LEAENKEQLDRIRKIDRKQESKIISQASKNFNIHLHSQRLLKQDRKYIDELNELINKKILFFTHPSLMEVDDGLNKKKKDSFFDESQSDASVLKTGRLNKKSSMSLTNIHSQPKEEMTVSNFQKRPTLIKNTKTT